MRATRRPGYGLAVVLLIAAGARGQFAVERSPSAAPAQPPGALPPPAPAAPYNGLTPASSSSAIPGSLPPLASAGQLETESASKLLNHPLALKPEHGTYVIFIKSYVRPSNAPEGTKAVQMAEALAEEVRSTYRTPTYLFEFISDEQRAEWAAKKAAIQKAAPFLEAIKQQERRAQERGTDFVRPDSYIRFKTVRYNEQISVMIAGFKTEDEARKGLEVVRKWPVPKNKSVLDGTAIVGLSQDDKPVRGQGFINPYAMATVARNPTLPRASSQVHSGVDDFTIRLNQGRPYNLLNARKPWTLAVKTFNGPAAIQGKDQTASVFRRRNGNGAEVLMAGAAMAEQLAGILRNPKMSQAGGQTLEAFVLHTRSGSLVTVGQFDGPNDPALLQTRRLLMSMNFMVSDKENMPGRPIDQQNRLFSDNILPIPVPR